MHTRNQLKILPLLLSLLAAAAAYGAPTSLTDFWNGKAVWASDTEQIGKEFHFHFPQIMHERNELWAYYIHGPKTGDPPQKSTVGRARGTDGLRWTDDGIVLDVSRPLAASVEKRVWDDRLTSFPGVWKDGDTWYLVYEGAADDIAFSPGDIGLATSKDGRTFTKHPNNPILRHETTGWERVNIGTPSLYKENGTWYLFYHGYDGAVCQIGVASGPDLLKLTKSPANPIVPTAVEKDAWDVGTAGRRSTIFKEGDFYYFAYEGSTAQPYTQSKWSSGLARTKDLTGPWEKFAANPIVSQTPTGFGHDGPEFARIGDTMYLYVRTVNDNSTQRYRLEVRN